MSFARSPLSFAIFSILSTSLYAESTISTSSKNTDQASVTLNTISLKAEKENEVGKTLYTKEDIERVPNSSKNITNFLKVNPNVQFSNNFRSGLQQGELNPAEISINGGLPYDNKFLINGMSINNNINPVGATISNSTDKLMGTSQTVSVNTDLLCNITVLDSNVSAEYGEFTGGVVSAETCAPKTKVGEVHGSINYDYTSNSWSKINFPDQKSLDEYENSKKVDQQPYFTKQGVSATLYGNLTDQLGFNAFGSFRHSLIPLKTNFSSPQQIDQKRMSSNYGLELFYTPSDTTTLKVGTQLFENTGEYFEPLFLNSDSTHKSDSQSFYINLKNKLSFAQVEQQLNYQTQTSSRDAEQDLYSGWVRSSTINWNLSSSAQNKGNFGSIEQQEKKLEYSIKAAFDPIQFANVSHQLKVGTGYGQYDVYWERPETANTYFTSSKHVPNLSCYDLNGNRYDACDEGNGNDGQFAKSLTRYHAGKINIKQDRWHAYIEDLININPYIQTTLGLRADYDSLTKNYNIAPRSSLVLKPFGDNQLSITAGWNRYYGLNSFANELQDQKGILQTKLTRVNVEDDWGNPSSTLGKNLRSELNTPYSDESVFAINGNLWNINAGIKFVHRENKDQLRKQKNSEYDNSGTSESDILTLSLRNSTPVAFKNSSHYLSLNADITKTKRNFDTYDTSFYSGTPQIYYDGKLIDAEDKPADNYNTPWTVRLDWNIGFTNIPLNINNYFSYRASTPSMKKTASTSKTGFVYELDGIKYDTYTPYETKGAFNWDMRATYAILSSKNTQAILGLTINNVINRKNEYVVSGVATPEIGRQFIADITFKF